MPTMLKLNRLRTAPVLASTLSKRFLNSRRKPPAAPFDWRLRDPIPSVDYVRTLADCEILDTLTSKRLAIGYEVGRTAGFVTVRSRISTTIEIITLADAEGAIVIHLAPIMRELELKSGWKNSRLLPPQLYSILEDSTVYKVSIDAHGLLQLLSRNGIYADSFLDLRSKIEGMESSEFINKTEKMDSRDFHDLVSRTLIGSDISDTSIIGVFDYDRNLSSSQALDHLVNQVVLTQLIDVEVTQRTKAMAAACLGSLASIETINLFQARIEKASLIRMDRFRRDNDIEALD